GARNAKPGDVVWRSCTDLLGPIVHGSTSRLQEPGDDIEERRLARTIRTNETYDLAGRNLEADVAQRIEPLKPLADAMHLQCARWRRWWHERSFRHSRLARLGLGASPRGRRPCLAARRRAQCLQPTPKSRQSLRNAGNAQETDHPTQQDARPLRDAKELG